MALPGSSLVMLVVQGPHTESYWQRIRDDAITPCAPGGEGLSKEQVGPGLREAGELQNVLSSFPVPRTESFSLDTVTTGRSSRLQTPVSAILFTFLCQKSAGS